ncbi:MAG: D-alanyl-D-alanine carboxypeptidase/D-alanyl-D-alanine-endopeptidase, partial [Acaryochloridaceae cyanobacterium RL_2_7]|nr:D-alanyl-D-alanine carboxypeptidase/D-alanyl-D-alanine-endopeptidase [Acaryochloridaceae cyanobacterium RL_2_7]
NFYTESLLRYWAWQSQPVRQPVTPQQSLKRLEDYLAPLGVDPASYELQDASGLSRQNLVSPESLVALLEVAQKWQYGEERDRAKSQTFLNSLAVAGEAGTLKRRFVDTPVSGKFRGKTGTLRGTVTLAGILEMPDQSSALVSIMANQSDQSTTRLRTTVDAMILQLDQSLKCSTPR